MRLLNILVLIVCLTQARGGTGAFVVPLSSDARDLSPQLLRRDSMSAVGALGPGLQNLENIQCMNLE